MNEEGYKVLRALFVTLVVALAFVLILFAFNSGQDRQCAWWHNHHPGSYEELKYCGH